jgi:hypothetical protein
MTPQSRGATYRALFGFGAINRKERKGPKSCRGDQPVAPGIRKCCALGLRVPEKFFAIVVRGGIDDIRESHMVFASERARRYADRIKSSGFRFLLV